MILKILKYIVYIVILIAVYIFMRNIYNRHYFGKLFSNPSSLMYKLNGNGSSYSLDTWMSNVNPSIPINKLVMPGTHDSLTYEWEKSYSIMQQFSSFWAKTQYLTTKQQLLSGVRYFDARCGKYSDKVVVFHGILSTNITYEECIDELVEFINTHPSEIIIWKVRILNNEDVVKPIITKCHSKLNLIPSTSSYFHSTLEELRDRRPDKNRGGVILVSSGGDWPDSKIFDPYDHAALMTDKKSFTMSKPVFKMSMNKIYSNKEVDPTAVSVMQMIAEYQVSTKTSLLDSIETISKRINRALIDKDLPPPPKTGYNIIMIDFLTPELSNHIIQLNSPSTFIK
jgi:hypothetical protein